MEKNSSQSYLNTHSNATRNEEKENIANRHCKTQSFALLSPKEQV